MKKLLLIGAMLIVGATSFSASVTELTEGTDGNVGKYSGTGLLDINSTGKILDPTGRAMLVINPITNAGPDGESMLFDFGSVGRGIEVKQVGSFEAEVLTKKTIQQDEEGSKKEIVKSDLTNKITVKLARTGGQVSTDGQKVKKFTVISSTSANGKLVDLSYQLSGTSGLINGGKTYSGEILATAYRPLKTDATNDGASYVAGRFDDKSVSLEVTITDVVVEVETKGN